jgi:flagellar hook-associated protein 2
MGAVGINFGAATGGSGFDVTTTVASIVANLQLVENPWTTQLTSLKAQDTAFTSVGSDLATLSTSVLALTDFEGVMASKLGSSSDTNVLTLSSAASTAVAGSHTVIVSQLAQTSSEVSAVVSASDTLSGALTFQVGPTGTPQTVPVIGGTSDTLATYAAAVNAAGIGVTASVISDTTGSRLSFVSDTSGVEGQLTLTGGGTVAASTVVTAAAASVAPTATVAASNTFTLPSAASELSGTFSYAVGSGSTGTVNLGSAPLSLAATAAALDADSGFASAGLNATVSGANLVITGATDASGEATIVTDGSSLTTTTPAATYGALTDATASTAIATSTGLLGQDALLTVDGLHVDTASNTVSTVIPGVTFQLLSKSTTPVQIQIANDNSDIETAFSTFVTAYNAVVKDITTQEGNNSSGNPEPLYGSTVISQLQSALSLALTSGVASGSVNNLYQLGISVNNDGTLTLDTSALDSELNSNYFDVVGFLQNTGSFGQNLAATLDNLGSSSPTGAITLALAADSTQEATFNSDVIAQNALIAAQQARITTELNTANETLQSIPQQLDEVNELYSALTGYNTTPSG